MIVTSPSFAYGANLPFSCGYEAENRSPALSWTDVPAGTETLALMCEDLDAVSHLPWTHWLVWNINPCDTGLPGGLPSYEVFTDGMTQGYNDYLELGWGGPCPPTGIHRYSFVLYALDSKIEVPSRTRNEFDQAITGHILATANLLGVFQAEQPLVSFQKARAGRSVWG